MEFEVKNEGAKQDIGLKHFAIFTTNDTGKITLFDEEWDAAHLSKLAQNKAVKDENTADSTPVNPSDLNINSGAALFIILALFLGILWYQSSKNDSTLKENEGIKKIQDKTGEVLKSYLLQQATDLLIATLKKIFILNPAPSLAREYATVKDDLQPDGSNFVGVLAALPADTQEAVLNRIKSYTKLLPEREITDLRIEKVGLRGRDAMLVCTETLANGDTYEMDTSGLSDGTLRFLMTITAVLTLPKGSLLVIDEIDNGIHPSRAAMIVNMLIEESTARGVDIIVTAHNPAFLDQMMPDLIPFVMLVQRDADTGCSIVTPLQDLPNLNYLLSKGGLGRAISDEKMQSKFQTAKKMAQ
jgi:hypothetical protein